MSKNKIKYTVSESIRSVNGITRKRFYEMLDSGDISYEKEKWGNKERRVIEGAELSRVFGRDFILDETTDTTNKNNYRRLETTNTTIKNNALQIKVDALEQQVVDKNNVIEDLRGDRDNWKDSAKQAQETITRQTYLLEHYQKPPDKLPDEQESLPLGNHTKNASTPFYELITAFIVLVAVITLIVMTRDVWTPLVESWIKQ